MKIKLDPTSDESRTVLVSKKEKDIIRTIKNWSDKGVEPVEGSQILATWTSQGKVFDLTDSGTAALIQAEEQTVTTTPKLLDWNRLHHNLYVNVNPSDADDLRLVRASVGKSVIDDVKSGRAGIQDLVERGEAFQNISHLFIDESITTRANNIAFRLKADYSMTSEEWRRWTDRTAAYNLTSLAQVFAAYYRDYSAGDIGEGDGYSPRPGYPGTLAPGENFKESDSIKSLPRYLLHPWPALQEHQFHVRWPPGHPLVPPPLLFFALNNMLISVSVGVSFPTSLTIHRTIRMPSPWMTTQVRSWVVEIWKPRTPSVWRRGAT